MINSRSLDDLHPTVKRKALAFIAAAKAEDIDLIVTSTYRDAEAQAALYAQGRSAPGKRRTNAKPGQSWHNWRCALDVAIVDSGKLIWDDHPAGVALWKRVGAIGKKVGLDWAGDWVSFKEMAHFQHTGGLTLADFQAGKKFA